MEGKSFYISVGDTNTGPMGLCIRLTLPGDPTMAEVITYVRDHLWKQGACDGIDISQEVTKDQNNVGIEYATLYLNPEHITIRNVSTGDTEDVTVIPR